jgi:hypothetical protein
LAHFRKPVLHASGAAGHVDAGKNRARHGLQAHYGEQARENRAQELEGAFFHCVEISRKRLMGEMSQLPVLLSRLKRDTVKHCVLGALSSAWREAHPERLVLVGGRRVAGV